MKRYRMKGKTPLTYRFKFLIVVTALVVWPAVETHAQTAASAVTAAAIADTPAAFGAVAGTVTDTSTHQPVAFAVVVAERQPDPRQKGIAPNAIQVSSRTARTAADGFFTIPNLPAGTYVLCVHAVHDRWLNPCQWSDVRHTADVKEGKTTNQPQIPMEKGAVLKLRLDDPAKTEVSRVNSEPGTELLISTRGKRGLLQRPRIASRDAGGIDYELLVPAGQVVKFSVQAKTYKLADESGKAVGDADGDLLVTVPKDATEHSVKVTITGRK